MWDSALALFQLVWRQLESAFFSALTSVGALFIFGEVETKQDSRNSRVDCSGNVTMVKTLPWQL